MLQMVFVYALGPKKELFKSLIVLNSFLVMSYRSLMSL